MTARFGGIKLPPGGDVIGRRRVDTTFLPSKLWAQILNLQTLLNSLDGLIGADILLDEASVTATENTIMAAVLAKGVTHIHNAASASYSGTMPPAERNGRKIKNIGSNILEIEGVEKLHGTEFTIGPDYLEVISYVGAAVVTGGEIRIKDAGSTASAHDPSGA